MWNLALLGDGAVPSICLRARRLRTVAIRSYGECKVSRGVMPARTGLPILKSPLCCLSCLQEVTHCRLSVFCNSHLRWRDFGQDVAICIYLLLLFLNFLKKMWLFLTCHSIWVRQSLEIHLIVLTVPHSLCNNFSVWNAKKTQLQNGSCLRCCKFYGKSTCR